jgi:putative PIN family toxin of toxin-antitoxin system
MFRAVLDPGVLVSALLSPSGTPAALYLAAMTGEFELVVCPHLLNELLEVLGREKLRRYVLPEEAAAFAVALRRVGRFQPDPEIEPGVTPDPDDDYLVALARAAGAHAIVSGDRRLVELKGVSPRIVTPARFLLRLRAQARS